MTYPDHYGTSVVNKFGDHTQNISTTIFQNKKCKSAKVSELETGFVFIYLGNLYIFSRIGLRGKVEAVHISDAGRIDVIEPDAVVLVPSRVEITVGVKLSDK